MTKKGLEWAWNAMAKEKLIKIDKKKAKREPMPSSTARNGDNAGDEPSSKRARIDYRTKVRFCFLECNRKSGIEYLQST